MKFKEEKLCQILHAGTEEFLTKGCEAASMHNIAAMAEVSKRTLYKYFPSKDALLSAIIDRLLEKMLSYCQLEYVHGENFEEQLNRIIDSRITFLTSEDFTKMSRLTLSEMIRGRKLDQTHLEKIDKIDAHFTAWIDAAKKDKKIRTEYDSRFISGQFHSIIKGEVFYPVVMGLKSVKDVDMSLLKEFLIKFFVQFFC